MWISVDPLALKYPNFSSYNYCFGNPIVLIDPDGQGPGWNRFTGGLQMVGGVLEAAVGGLGGIATSETGVGLALGIAVFANGVDNATTGYKQMISGETQETMLHQGTKSIAKTAGASDKTAENIATFTDLTTVFLGGASSIKLSRGLRLTTQETQIYSKIGSTGKVGEDALKLLGGKPQAFFRTSKGGRYIDQLVDGVAHESKVGYTTLTNDIKTQIAKDAELLKDEKITSSIWHFFKSPVTGKVGASQPLLNELKKNGIKVIIHQ